jgi:hypothetical protein
MPAAVAAMLVASSKRRRRLVGGVNKAKAIKAFQRSRDHFKAGEPDSGDSGSDGDGPPEPSRKKRRITYSREKKL